MKRSSGIVVDADVSRSSADPSDSPRALACARALMAIRGCESLHIAFEDKLKREWHKHQGRFARKWLLSMHARRRVTTHASIPAWTTLRTIIAAFPPRARRALAHGRRQGGWPLPRRRAAGANSWQAARSQIMNRGRLTRSGGRLREGDSHPHPPSGGARRGAARRRARHCLRAASVRRGRRRRSHRRSQRGDGRRGGE
jgi:hypothetical protein